MNTVFSTIKPAAATRLPSSSRQATPAFSPYQAHQHAAAPLRAFNAYSGPSNVGRSRQSAAEALQALLHSDLASSMVGMAEGAAAQGMQQVRRAAAAATAAAQAAAKKRGVHLALGEEAPVDEEDFGVPASPPLGGVDMRVRSALEEASYQTNESRKGSRD